MGKYKPQTCSDARPVRARCSLQHAKPSPCSSESRTEHAPNPRNFQRSFHNRRARQCLSNPPASRRERLWCKDQSRCDDYEDATVFLWSRLLCCPSRVRVVNYRITATEKAKLANVSWSKSIRIQSSVPQGSRTHGSRAECTPRNVAEVLMSCPRQ